MPDKCFQHPDTEVAQYYCQTKLDFALKLNDSQDKTKQQKLQVQYETTKRVQKEDLLNENENFLKKERIEGQKVNEREIKRSKEIIKN